MISQTLCGCLFMSVKTGHVVVTKEEGDLKFPVCSTNVVCVQHYEAKVTLDLIYEQTLLNAATFMLLLIGLTY